MNVWTIRLRSIARRFGVTRLVARFRSGRDYEAAFSQSMLDQVRHGDCVWDIGANVGHYTLQFAQRVGAAGSVVAFEPVPACLRTIQEMAERENLSNVELVQAALSAESGTAKMWMATDSLGVTHQLRDPTANGDSSRNVGALIDVKVYAGDDARRQLGLTAPAVIKLDVEGFELDALRGLSRTLSEESLRAVFVEVHFAELEKRGLRDAPLEIEKLLHGHGLSRTVWLDGSHLAGFRGPGVKTK